MIKTAKFLVEQKDGRFPETHAELLKLPGIGPYTAAAISSFAFNLPNAVVDGNVYRVLSRVFGIYTPIDSTNGKKEFQALADNLIDRQSPGAYNQALMDFGANVCVPKAPKCSQCPFHSTCFASRKKMTERLPVKEKQLVRKTRFFNFLVFRFEDYTYIEKRKKSDIWKSLYQFPMIEDRKLLNKKQLKKSSFKVVNKDSIRSHLDLSQTLTHQNIKARFFEIMISNPEDVNLNGTQRVAVKNLNNFAFPKIVGLFLEHKILNS